MRFPPRSYTLYFYAQSEYILDRSEPRLTAIDDANNVCFAIRGNKLWFQKHNLVGFPPRDHRVLDMRTRPRKKGICRGPQGIPSRLPRRFAGCPAD